MKKLLYLLIAVSLVLALAPAAAMAHTETAPFTADLMAGQTEDVGDVNVWNDPYNLYVQFVSAECMVETHLHVATSLEDIPQKNGNPIPGKFAYSQFHGCSKDYTYTIPLTWDTSTELYIAAHAALGQEETMMIYSDGGAGTNVTAGNVPDATYPHPAVDAWEAFNDPPDTGPSYWDQQLRYGGSPFSFSMADWIWESYRVVDWTTTQDVTFEHPFTVPGYPTGGRLHIATDNTYSVSLNGTFVGEHTDWQTWHIGGGYDIFALEGANVLQVIGSNYGDPGYTQYNNPAGVIYEAEITYLTPGETAWADGPGFPGKNWATYFNYTVQPLKIAGWDTTRGGTYSLNHTYSTQARTDLENKYGDVNFGALGALTASDLADAHVVVLSSVRSDSGAVTALIPDEQAALSNFVLGGGCAILFPDNNTFAGVYSDIANESLIDPFGLDIMGTLSGAYNATVASGWTSIVSYIGNYAGWFDGTDGATVLGTLDASGQPSLVEFAPDYFGTGSGRVVVYSDANIFFGGGSGKYSDNAQLFLDTVDACFQP